MLDSETKRRIDTARDILVGKVPDPKSQVEQITIALIYKFMDDMDAESEEFGGKRTFFAGEFERYGWAKLMRSGLGGFEVINLYAEAIAKMPENPGIPLLFRSIFKNAFLPYRDPETLRAFLKIIDDFSYDHSERLGDAFEYLLSVLGSQGDAGQFRTPRHIIDFMVAVLDPKKTETVLDPACGTAGFLISSYKHILEASRDENGNSRLTPDERERLVRNFRGYDISPDMVRLSLVNLYLHGFVDPNIAEYDTLTSLDKWNEYADVILANPPFMSPKGGIKPHKRFSVQSSRSEVLFVDYMAEHLTPTGRAGIIVPEGIIFQSQNAYKQLRKVLVENFLVAVVSLPAGMFNPYSGVKTSILILDKTLAKKSGTIGFFKLEKDGYGLGSQRRPLCSDNGDKPELCQEHSDIPLAHKEIAEYLRRLRVGGGEADFQPKMGLVVEKEKIAANGDYNLSGERYRDGAASVSTYPQVQLSEVAQVKNGFAFKSEEYVSSGLRVMRIKNVQKGKVIDDDPKFIAVDRAQEFASYRLRAGDILVSLTGNVGRVGKLEREHEPALLNQRVAQVETVDYERLIPEFLFAILNTNKFESDAIQSASGVAQANLSSKWIEIYPLPLPPIEVQREIVTEIEGYQKIIDGARAVVENWAARIQIDSNWPEVLLDEYIEFVSGLTLSIPDCETPDGIPIISMNNIAESGMLTKNGLRFIKIPKKTGINYLQKGDLLFNWRNGSKHLVGKTGYFDWEGDYVFASFCLGIRPKPELLDSRYLWILLNQYRIDGNYQAFMRQNVNGLFNREELRILPIKLPPLSIQKAIVANNDEERFLVDSNRKLIELYEKKIQVTLARVWGEDTPDSAKAVTAES